MEGAFDLDRVQRAKYEYDLVGCHTEIICPDNVDPNPATHVNKFEYDSRG